MEEEGEKEEEERMKKDEDERRKDSSSDGETCIPEILSVSFALSAKLFFSVPFETRREKRRTY